MTDPYTDPFTQIPNSDNSPGGVGNMDVLNSNGVGNGNQIPSQLTNLVNAVQDVNLGPENQPAAMKTFIYSPDIQVKIATPAGKEYDVSADVVRGTLFRRENSASTFICELSNQKGQYTKNGKGLLSRMDRITVYMKRVNWIQVFSGYLDTVPFAQMWAGNVTIKATCTLKRLLYTYWNPNLPASAAVFNQKPTGGIDIQQPLADTGLGDLIGNLVCWIGGWEPQNVHIQDIPLKFYNDMEVEFQKYLKQSVDHEDAFKTMLLGYDHSTGVGSAAGQKSLSTGPGLGPQVIGSPAYKQQVLQAVDDRGMGPIIKDIQSSYSQQEYSASGMATKQASQLEAFEKSAALGTSLQTQARTSDAAILAFACVYAESSWMMYANPTVPESLSYHHDMLEPSWEGTSMGLFQQINQGWGTVAQRMNPYASAGMFLDALNQVAGWRNMDPAQAIALVQRNRDGALSYSPWVAVATEEVQGLRAAQGKYTPQSTGAVGIGVSSVVATTTGQSVAGTVSTAINGITGLSQNTPAPGALPVSIPGRPQPDAQGAVLMGQTLVGRPFAIGGNGPLSFDSAGLMEYCYRGIGRSIGRTKAEQAQSAMMRVQGGLAYAKPGDVIHLTNGHVAMLTAPGLVLDVGGPGEVVKNGPIMFPPTDIEAIYRYAEYGGPGPAPFNPVPGQGLPVGVGSTAGGVRGTGSDGQQEQIARNLFSYIFTPARFAPTVANLFSGEKSFIDCQPLIQEVQAVAKAGLRNFASAPNGDFIAYYPDYFGVDGKPISMVIENIEMKDVKINLSDDAMTTHVYVSGDITTVGQTQEALGWLTSTGVATVENEALYQRLKRVVPGGVENLSGRLLLQKYGVRPLQAEFNMVQDHRMEFLLACQLFMQKWAEQYETSVSFTFMPELFPGMRIQLADIGIACYVSEVTHNFDWEQGFSTQAKIMAPSAANSGSIATDPVMTNIPADATTSSVATSVPFSG